MYHKYETDMIIFWEYGIMYIASLITKNYLKCSHDVYPINVLIRIVQRMI